MQARFRKQSEERDKDVLDRIVQMMLVEGNHRTKAAHHVKHESSRSC